MQFGGQSNQGQMDSPLRPQVPVIETLEEHESNEEGEDEVEDGCIPIRDGSHFIQEY